MMSTVGSDFSNLTFSLRWTGNTIRIKRTVYPEATLDTHKLEPVLSIGTGFVNFGTIRSSFVGILFVAFDFPNGLLKIHNQLVFRDLCTRIDATYCEESVRSLELAVLLL